MPQPPCSWLRQHAGSLLQHSKLASHQQLLGLPGVCSWLLASTALRGVPCFWVFEAPPLLTTTKFISTACALLNPAEDLVSGLLTDASLPFRQTASSAVDSLPEQLLLTAGMQDLHLAATGRQLQARTRLCCGLPVQKSCQAANSRLLHGCTHHECRAAALADAAASVATLH